MRGSQDVLVVICAAALAATGCARTVDGAAVAADAPNHTTMTTTTGPVPAAVPIAVLDRLLLTQQQIVALVGGVNMALVITANSTSDASTIGDVTTYSNSGYVGMRGTQFSTPNVVAADVTQLVTSFPAAADAQGLLQRARQDWQGCANQRYGFHSSNGNHSYLDTQELRGGGSRIELSMHKEDPSWWCSHAMAVQNNVVIQARVCLLGKDTAAAANNLLDQVVARIPQ
jgi:hypothetical protein